MHRWLCRDGQTCLTLPPAATPPGTCQPRSAQQTDDLPGVPAPGRLDGAAGTLGGVEGCRAAGAAPRARRAAAAEPQAQVGLGRPGDTRRPGPPAPRAGACHVAGVDVELEPEFAARG